MFDCKEKYENAKISLLSFLLYYQNLNLKLIDLGVPPVYVCKDDKLEIDKCIFYIFQCVLFVSFGVF